MPIKQDTDVSSLLDLAADLMEEHGWIQGDYFEGDYTQVIDGASMEYQGGAMCTEGAIRAASTLIWHDKIQHNGSTMPGLFHGLADATNEAFEAVRLIVGAHSNIPHWNDKVCCTKEQAVAALRDAATKTRPDMP